MHDTITGMQILGPLGMDDLGVNIKDMLSNAMPKSKKPRKMPVSEAREVLIQSLLKSRWCPLTSKESAY